VRSLSRFSPRSVGSRRQWGFGGYALDTASIVVFVAQLLRAIVLGL
jgi:hypothetical protein